MTTTSGKDYSVEFSDKNSAKITVKNHVFDEIFLDRGGDGNFFIWSNMERPLFKTPAEAREFLVERYVKSLTKHYE